MVRCCGVGFVESEAIEPHVNVGAKLVRGNCGKTYFSDLSIFGAPWPGASRYVESGPGDGFVDRQALLNASASRSSRSGSSSQARQGLCDEDMPQAEAKR